MRGCMHQCLVAFTVYVYEWVSKGELYQVRENLLDRETFGFYFNPHIFSALYN